MFRKIALSLGWAGLLVVAACTDSPRSTTAPDVMPGGPVFSHVAGHCNADLAKTISSEQKLFSTAVAKQLADQLKLLKNACAAGNGNEVSLGFDYVAIVFGATPVNTLSLATSIALHVDHLTTYIGLGAGPLNPAAVATGGGACVIPLGGGSCTTEGFIQGLVNQPDHSPVDLTDLSTVNDFPAHIVSIVRNSNANCLSAPLPTQTNYCIDVTYFPAAKGFFNQLQVAMCTQDEDSPFADVSNPLVTLGHKKSTTGKVEALTRWPSPTTAATLVCGHGSPPSVAAGRFRGVMESFLASVKNTFLPRPLYAVNGGLGISDDFGDGTSPFASVNTLVFYDDFSTDIIGTAPALQSTDVGTSWFSSVQSPGSITVQTGLGFVQDTVVVLSQALGNCENCPTLSLIGTLAYGSPGVLHDVGTYVAAVRMTQNKPAPKDAPMVLQSSTGGEIARLTYVAESGTKYLRYSGNGGAPANIFYTSGPLNGQLVTWQIGVGQNFEITVNLDANTTTLTVDGYSTTATNVAFGNIDLGKIAWLFGGIDAGEVGVTKVSITRSIDP